MKWEVKCVMKLADKLGMQGTHTGPLVAYVEAPIHSDRKNSPPDRGVFHDFELS
jgi:hypothetical protein